MLSDRKLQAMDCPYYRTINLIVTRFKSDIEQTIGEHTFVKNITLKSMADFP